MLATIYMVYAPHIHDVYIGSTTDPLETVYEQLLAKPPKCMQPMVDEGNLEIKPLEISMYNTKRAYKEALWKYKVAHWKHCVNKQKPKGMTKKVKARPQTYDSKVMCRQVADEVIRDKMVIQRAKATEDDLQLVAPIEGDWTIEKDVREVVEVDPLELIRREIAELEG